MQLVGIPARKNSSATKIENDTRGGVKIDDAPWM
jgi:hypothetical protein